ncbi:hypothetical protein RDWZM_000800 [Blomia tropicalis]|uniref:SAC3/GANP/THP3 conserved domain-containing protein n=1 Tax=Blomia tropicalis TaxID=40697 RepID=A0A9Q0MAI7_BLOTA|nr:hypothetical protein RDWZM_000800 [Blomia tropicalis]
MVETEDERQWQAKLNETAKSLMDKKLILDARDKLLRLKQERQTDISTAVAVVGTCPDMCPEQERYFRIETNCVSSFELDDSGKPDQTRMVKEYRRSGADQKEPLSHDLRPINVLKRTMTYLCLEIIDIELDPTESNKIGEWYDFIWSRTRSIRKDITQQHLINTESVSLIEKCARFHIFCAYHLCEEEVRDFDPKINNENLYNCLQTLKEFYFDLSTRFIYCDNEAEFRCYDILLNLRNGETLSELKHFRKDIRNCDDVRFAVKIYQSYHSRNHVKFFQMARRANFFMSCILNQYVNQFRIDLLTIMCRAYTIPKSNNAIPYPVEDVIEQFAFDNESELFNFCDLTDLKYDSENIYFQRNIAIYGANIKRRSHLLVQSKLTTTPGQAILAENGSMFPTTQILPVHSSFDNQNRLIFDPETFSTTNNNSFLRQNVVNIKEKDNISKQFSFVVNESETTSSEKNNSTNLFKWPTVEFKPVEKSLFQITNEPPKDLFANSFAPSSSFTFNVTKNFKSNENVMNEQKSTQISFSNVEQTTQPIPVIDPVVKESIFLDLVNELTEQECQESIERVKEISEREEFIESESNKCFDEIVMQVLGEVAHERLVAYLQWKRKKIVLEFSHNLLNELISDVVESTIEETIHKVKASYRQQQLISRSNDVFNSLFSTILKQIGQQVIYEQTELRNVQIKQWRCAFLLHKYWFRWHNFYLKRKQFRLYRDSFPAAPSFLLNGDYHQHDNFNRQSSNRTIIDRSYIKAYDSMKRNLAYSKYKNPKMLNQHVQNNMIEKQSKNQLTQLDYLKRNHFLQQKYFNRWLHLVRNKKRNFIRSQLPAAPRPIWERNPMNHRKFTHHMTIIDTPIKNANQSIQQNLLRKLNYDYDNTVEMIKRKLDERDAERYSRNRTK